MEISDEVYTEIKKLFNKYLEYCDDSSRTMWTERGIGDKHLFVQDGMELERYVYDKDFDKDEEEFDEFCLNEFGECGSDMMDNSHVAIAMFYKKKFMAKFKKIVAGAMGLNQEAKE